MNHADNTDNKYRVRISHIVNKFAVSEAFVTAFATVFATAFATTYLLNLLPVEFIINPATTYRNPLY